MKKVKVSEKVSVLIAICDDEQRDDLQEYLTKKKLKCGQIFMGKGTAESTIVDMFGFGMSDKLITALIVPESSQEKILNEITKLLRIEIDRYGLTMLMEISSASSVLLDMVGVKLL